jgi:hypothetical protein
MINIHKIIPDLIMKAKSPVPSRTGPTMIIQERHDQLPRPWPPASSESRPVPE